MTSIQIGDPVPPSAQPQDDRGALVDITVNRLFASSLPKVSKIMKVIPRDVYCSINVGGIVQSTECVDARTDVVWPDVNLHFARVARSCVFKVELFIRHHRRADESLGYFEAPLASLVEETRNEPHHSHDLAGSLSGAKIIFNFSVQPSLQDPVRSLPPFNDTIRASAEPEQALATANAPIHPSQSLPRVFGTADTSANIPGEALVSATAVLDHMHVAHTSMESAAAAMNKATTAIDVLDPLLSKINIFTGVVDKIAEVHPYAKMAWSILSAAKKVFENQVELDKNVDGLLVAMDSFFDIVSDLRPDMLDSSRHRAIDLSSGRETSILARIAQQTVECCYFIEEYGSVESFARRTAKHTLSDTKAKVDEYKSALAQLKEEFHLRVAKGTLLEVTNMSITLARTMETMQAIGDNVELTKLTHAHAAGMNKMKKCLPGTRVETLNRLAEWINGPTDERVCFLVGGAGMGKSAIAHAIGDRFDSLDRLGAFFCFDRNFQGDRHPESVFSTIAWNLACWDPSFKRALADIITRRGSLADTPDIISQWEYLVVEPAKALAISGPVLLVIDALDESGHNGSRRLLLSFLTQHAMDLPPNFRVVVTSRPETDVMDAIRTKGTQVHCMNLEDEVAEAQEDIMVYICHRFSLVDSRVGRLDDSHCKVLAEKSEGLFQWAFTACEVILGPKMAGLKLVKRFDRLLGSIKPTGLKPIDALYSGVLAQVFDQDDGDVMTIFYSVMAQVLSAVEPLSVNSLEEIRRCWSNVSEDEVS